MKHPLVVVYSLLGLACLALTYFVHWLFILGAAFALYANQRTLMGKR